jgi:hypothetical protein
MIRVVLPPHLTTLIGVHGEIEVDVEVPASQRSLLDEVERRYPVLVGTIRDPATHRRRAFIRFFACEDDLSHQHPDARLPGDVESGREAFYVVGAMAGG